MEKKNKIDKSYLTAIHRKSASAPLMWLLKHNLINGRVLDYGCGYGTDVLELQKRDYEAAGYDPYFFNDMPKGSFDTVLCTYVLNVLPADEQKKVIEQLKKKLKKNRRAYITVRRDIKQPITTSHGTYQDYVLLPFPVVTENKRYCIYELTL